MQQATMKIELPANFLQYNITPEKVQGLVREWLVIDLFTSDQVSSGQAARLLGISRIEFLDLLHKRHIAYLEYDEEELSNEFETARNLQIDATQ